MFIFPRMQFHVDCSSLVRLCALALLAQSAVAQTYTVLHSFAGPPDGADPIALMIDNAGNLYGATLAGGGTGVAYCSQVGCGTVFKIDSAGNESVLYAFAPTDAFNGWAPDGPYLVLDSGGNVYGTASGGGLSGCGLYGLGCGTVFRVSSTGQESVLHRFTDANADDVAPAGLVRDAAGNLYGTTYGSGYWGQGTVFKMDGKGNKTVLHTFHGYPDDGAFPRGVILDSLGNLYGVTARGGVRGVGTIFEISNTGEETILHDFGATGSTGTNIQGTLVRDSAGNFYGTTVNGGLTCGDSGCGIVYKLDAAGNFTVLHGFAGQADGAYPMSGLTLDTAGNLYGTTSSYGGPGACGTVFKIRPGGGLTVLHTFTECGNAGVAPRTAPILDAQGNLYGTTSIGGVTNSACIYGCGIVFKITP